MLNLRLHVRTFDRSIGELFHHGPALLFSLRALIRVVAIHFLLNYCHSILLDPSWRFLHGRKPVR